MSTHFSSSIISSAFLASVLLSVLLATSVSAQSWQVHSSLLQARSDTVALTVGDFTYIGGGCVRNQSVTGYCEEITDSFERYEHLNDRWFALRSLPRLRYRHAMAAVGSKLFLIGGRDLADNVITEVDVFDTNTGLWSTLPTQNNWPLSNTSLTAVSDGAAFVIGTKIYHVGGYSADYSIVCNSTIVLDTADGTGKFRSGLVPNRGVSAGDLGAVAIAGKGYAFGGFSYDFCTPLASLEQYDPITNRWTARRDMVHARGDLAYAVAEGWLFVMGGETKQDCQHSLPVGDVERYLPTEDLWADVAPIALSRFRFTGTAYNDTVFDIGGQGAPLNSTLPYFPMLDDVYSLDVSFLKTTSAADSASVSALAVAAAVGVSVVLSSMF